MDPNDDGFNQLLPVAAPGDQEHEAGRPHDDSGQDIQTSIFELLNPQVKVSETPLKVYK